MFEIEKTFKNKLKKIQEIEALTKQEQENLLTGFNTSFKYYWDVYKKYGKKKTFRFKNMKIANIFAQYDLNFKKVPTLTLTYLYPSAFLPFLIFPFLTILSGGLHFIWPGTFLSTVLLLAFISAVATTTIGVAVWWAEGIPAKHIDSEDIYKIYGIDGLKELHDLIKKEAQAVLPDEENHYIKLDTIQAEKELGDYIWG